MAAAVRALVESMEQRLLLAGSPPQLEPGVLLQSGGGPMQTETSYPYSFSTPNVADWNGDGKKDLIIGMFAGDPGNVRLYLNVGTDAEPKFDKFTCMEADGKPILLSAG